MPNYPVSSFLVEDDGYYITATASKTMGTGPIEIAGANGDINSVIASEEYLRLLGRNWLPLSPGNSKFGVCAEECADHGNGVFVKARMSMRVNPSSRRFVDTLGRCWSPETGGITITFKRPGHWQQPATITCMDKAIYNCARYAAANHGNLFITKITYEDHIVGRDDTIRSLNEVCCASVHLGSQV